MARLCLIALASLLLTACQGDLLPVRWPWSWPERGSFTWPWSEPTPQAPGQTIVTMLGPTGRSAENEAIQTQIAAFERSAPSIRVSGTLVPDYATALQDTFAGESPPDLFLVWGHQLNGLVADGALLRIPTAYDRAADLPAHLRAAFQVGGISYCIPRDLNTLALFYNPALFDRAETAYPTPDWSWADLTQAAAAVTDVNFGLYGMVQAADASRLLAWLAADDRDGSPWTGDDAIATTESYVNLYREGVAAVPLAFNSAWAGEAFGRGQAAMTLEGNWLIPFLAEEFPELDYGVLELPSGSARRSTVAFGSCWAISSQAADPQAALQLAAHLTTPEANWAWASASGSLPPSPEQARSWLVSHPEYAPFVAGLENAVAWTGLAGFAATVDALNSLLAAAIEDEASAQEVIERLQTPASVPLPTSAAAQTRLPPED